MLKRKFISILLALAAVFCLFSCGGNHNAEYVECEIISSSETRVVISVSKTEGSVTVLDCMQALKKTGALSFALTGGMVTEINGKANAADFSGCWMLYTSDAEMSNDAWGSITYESQTLGSAILGVETLTVEVGEIYAWEYTIF